MCVCVCVKGGITETNHGLIDTFNLIDLNQIKSILRNIHRKLRSSPNRQSNINHYQFCTFRFCQQEIYFILTKRLTQQ